MLKKYFPLILLVAAALLLYFIKTHQGGQAKVELATEQNAANVTIPAISPGGEMETLPEDAAAPGFNRNASTIIFSKHAKCRMDCRKIDESEVKDILKKGVINYKKIQSDKRGMTYPVEGLTHDNQRVRIVFAPKGDDKLVVVTVIDLETDWKCDCK